jgi:para-aminobenzoate synthetase component 1
MSTVVASPTDRLALMAQRPGALWLDTSSSTGSAGPWTTIAAEPAVWILGRGEQLQIEYGPRGDRGWRGAMRAVDPRAGTAYSRLATIWRRLKNKPTELTRDPEMGPKAPLFKGGLAGCFSYDLGRSFESVPERLPSELRWDFLLGLYDEVLNIRTDTGEVKHSSLRSPDGGASPTNLLEQWRRPEHGQSAGFNRDAVLDGMLISGMSRDDHADCVRQIRKHIVAGDIYQANLTFRFRGPWTDPDLPLATHLRLRASNPSPYGAYLDLPATRIVSASPEAFLGLHTDGRVRSRPIKGTRPRGEFAEDQRLREELLASAKDRAELAMIIDLVRNDLGRVCEPGSVTRTEDIIAEAHPSVWHLVGAVDGQLQAGLDAFDLLEASFPPGSCIGAPKIRAMEILEGLERSRRGAYTGAIGWIGADGAMATSVTIRTIVFRGGRAEYGVGGGIVYDSDPDQEWEEALLKGRALASALTAGSVFAK